MISTHLCQVLGFVAMEPPVHLDERSLRNEKAKVFAAMRPLDPERVVFGQYEGYRDEDDVADDSTVETFVALEAYVDTERWQGVPFYLRTGKALAATRRTITLTFRTPPMGRFGDSEYGPNELVLELSDSPKISVDLTAKRPGPDMELVPLTFTSTWPTRTPTTRRWRPTSACCSTSCAATRRCSPAPTRWTGCGRSASRCSTTPPPTQPYARGSWGPDDALALPGPEGWRLPDA